MATNEEGCTIYFVVLRLKGWLSILSFRRQTSAVYSSSKCLNCSSLNAGDVADVVPFSLLLQQLPPSPFFVKTRWGIVTYSM